MVGRGGAARRAGPRWRAEIRSANFQIRNRSGEESVVARGEAARARGGGRGSPRAAGGSPREDERGGDHRLKPVANLPPAQAGLKRWLGGRRGGSGDGMGKKLVTRPRYWPRYS